VAEWMGWRSRSSLIEHRLDVLQKSDKGETPKTELPQACIPSFVCRSSVSTQ